MPNQILTLQPVLLLLFSFLVQVELIFTHFVFGRWKNIIETGEMVHMHLQKLPSSILDVNDTTCLTWGVWS